MAQHVKGGMRYSTDDLIGMARLGNFGSYSPVIGRALTLLKQLEEERIALHETINELQQVEDMQN